VELVIPVTMIIVMMMMMATTMMTPSKNKFTACYVYNSIISKINFLSAKWSQNELLADLTVSELLVFKFLHNLSTCKLNRFVDKVKNTAVTIVFPSFSQYRVADKWVCTPPLIFHTVAVMVEFLIWAHT
jgi:hypothetical protein